MPHIKSRYLNGQRGTGYHASFDGIAQGAIAQYNIVIAFGVDGDRVKWRNADANVAGRRAGVMGIADHAAAATGDRVRIVSHKVITGVDTSGSTAAGYPVYLSETGGGWTTTAPTNAMVVGTVLVDDSDGTVLLAPAHCRNAFDGDGVVEP